MKSTSLADHKSALEKLIADTNAAVAELETKAEKARATIAKLESQWTDETLADAIDAQVELDAIEAIQERIPHADYRSRSLAARYINAHADEIQIELAKLIESKSKSRDAFRRDRAARLAAVTEKLALSENQNECRALGEEQARLEFEMEQADRLRDNAVTLARSLQLNREPELPQLTAAITSAAAISF